MPIPESEIDLFSDDTLQNTARAYKQLRDTGAIVKLPANDLYVITQFDAVRAVVCSPESGPLFELVPASDMELNYGQETEA